MSNPCKKEQYIIIYEPQGKYMHIHMKIIYWFNKKTEVFSKKLKTKKAQTKKQKEKRWLKIRWNHECIWLLLISDSLFIWYLSKDIVVGKFYVKSVTKS